MRGKGRSRSCKRGSSSSIWKSFGCRKRRCKGRVNSNPKMESMREVVGQVEIASDACHWSVKMEIVASYADEYIDHL